MNECQTDHNVALRKSEPEEYLLLCSPKFKRCRLGERDLVVGFCVNSPGGDGYTDETMIWVADQLTDPRRVIEVSIHECLHAIFPDLPESQVGTYGQQVAEFIVGVFAAKGTAPLPELRPLYSVDMERELRSAWPTLAAK